MDRVCSCLTSSTFRFSINTTYHRSRGNILSYLLNNITIPAIADSPLLESRQPNSRFPTMIFSHGLGGTRLAYSHFCCSIASHGVIVFAPEHRDGSGPVSVVRIGKESEGKAYITELVPYINIPHVLTQKMSEGRDTQLSIRLTELCLLYKALQSLQAGVVPKDTISSPSGQNIDGRCNEFNMFKGRLDIESPGRVIWAGHSFGAATMVQFIKTVYYMNTEEWKKQTSLLTLDEHQIGDLRRQITKNSPLLLLDLWSLSLLGSRRTYWLWKKPLPQVLPLGEEEEGGKPDEYDGSSSRILTIMSEQFYIWKENLWAVKWLLSRDPGRRDGGVKEILDYDPITGKNSPPPSEPSGDTTPYPDGFGGYRPPKLYYAKSSAHLTQSDFNLLLPFMFRNRVSDVRKVFGFNIRATVQWLREIGFQPDLQQYHDSVESGVGDAQIFGNSEIEGEPDGEEKSGAGTKLKGWVQLGLHEKPIEKKDLESAVTESMGANVEGDLEVKT